MGVSIVADTHHYYLTSPINKAQKFLVNKLQMFQIKIVIWIKSDQFQQLAPNFQMLIIKFQIKIRIPSGSMNDFSLVLKVKIENIIVII